MDLPEFIGSTIVRESCRYISATNRWYTLIYERPIYPTIPERCSVFPSVVREQEREVDYLLHAEYPDGTREIFHGFKELEYRFSARQVEMREDEFNHEEMS